MPQQLKCLKPECLVIPVDIVIARRVGRKVICLWIARMILPLQTRTPGAQCVCGGHFIEW